MAVLSRRRVLPPRGKAHGITATLARCIAPLPGGGDKGITKLGYPRLQSAAAGSQGFRLGPIGYWSASAFYFVKLAY